MNTENEMNTMENSTDIAVIGMSGRFPGAKNVDEFWRNLSAGIESVSFFSEKELLEAGVDPLLLKDPKYVKAMSILDNVEYFDAPFFKISPREAAITDPQHRIFLECAWEALENAGYDPERYSGRIGVYGGASMNTYFVNTGLSSAFHIDDMSVLIGNDKDFLTTRVSYKLNLKGPSIVIQSACSTSLVAVHIACQSLLNQECDMALAGGVCVRVPQKSGYLYREGDIVSPDGHCRTFDAEANGTVFGNGAGVVLLKRLSDAVADGDYIRAIIKGSAINNDGSLKAGFTAPSVDGQTNVLLEALANAGVNPETVSYIEAHGTGTTIGDPIEVMALNKAFRNFTDKKSYCAIGSVKSNIGHMDIAAGVISLIKTIMTLEKKMIPPLLHYKKANPEIDFPNTPFYVNTQLIPWDSKSPRRAGINSFGIGGTNAHVILEESPAISASGQSRPWQLFLLSARTETALDTATKNLAEHLKNHRDINLADVAFTLQNGRKEFEHRRIMVCRNNDDAINTLETGDPKRIISSGKKVTQSNVAFIFSGQGSQYVNMALELYQTETVFREQVDLCARILQPHIGRDLREVMYPPKDKTEKAEQEIVQTFMTQPALFTIEYALARLWMSWGVYPSAMVGHSIGEYVAACLAGVFSLEDALAIVAARGRLMQELPGGSMLSVFLSEKEIKPLIGDNIALAAINGPSFCVVSGEKASIAALEKQLSEKKINSRRLLTSHAFHSKMMDPILEKFADQLKHVRINKPQIPFLSNLTGKWILPNEATNPEYWAKHLRYTVKFSDCIEELLKEPERILLEVGPGTTFYTLAKLSPGADGHVILATTRHPKENRSDVSYVLNTLGQLWMTGKKIDWAGFYKYEERRRVPLPTYPFERQRHWIEMQKQPQSVITESIISGEPKKVTEKASKKKKTEKKSMAEADSSNIEQTLAQIWYRLLGIKDIGISDNFFDLGGSSVDGVRLFTEIEKIYDKKLPLATLFKAPTIGQLAVCIREYADTDEWKSLVEICPLGSKIPLFLVHAAGGNLLVYRDLINHLDPEQPVYGLQAQGLDRKQPFLKTIEEMAERYVKDILSVQPEGPYLLAGYCMGGTVALEMAQKLQAQGKKVALLVLFETYNWANAPAETVFDKFVYLMQKIYFVWGKFLVSQNKPDYILARINNVWGRANAWLKSLDKEEPSDTTTYKETSLMLYNLRKNNDKAAGAYKPKTYNGKITQFLPQKEYSKKLRRELSMDRLAAGGLEIHDMPTYPGGIFVEPYAKVLADKLTTCIEKSLGREPSIKKEFPSLNDANMQFPGRLYLRRVLEEASYLFLILRVVSLKFFMKKFLSQIYSNSSEIGFSLDLTNSEIPEIEAKIKYILHPATKQDMDEILQKAKGESEESAFHLVMQIWMYSDGYRRYYVARTKDTNEICFIQSIIFPDDISRARGRFKNRFPKLNEDEAIIESSYTFEKFRGNRLHPAITTDVLKICKKQNLKKMLAYVNPNNIVSIKGTERAGYKKFQIIKKYKLLSYIRWEKVKNI